MAVVINLVGYPGGHEGVDVKEKKERETVAEIASNAFDILLSDSVDGEFLSKQSGAIVRVLYKQKFFTVVYPIIPLFFHLLSYSFIFVFT